MVSVFSNDLFLKVYLNW